MVEIIRKKPLIFNPDEESKEMLITTFVIRQKIFKKIFKEIKDSSRNSPPQNFLLIGQRGMGKTTLLLRVKYEIEDDKNLSNYILTVRFSEEQYQIGCIPDLWEETATYLENSYPSFEGLLDEFLKYEREEDYERICFEILTKKLKDQDKRILFLIDNIGDLLHKFTDQENHRFREILMTSPYIQLLGASSEVLEHSFHYDKPFFEFFYQLKLEPLTKEEAIDLMKALADNYDVSNKIALIIEHSPQRIEALRRITGGVPRTLVLLFEIFIDYNDGSAFEDLEHLVDKVLPLYKARMDNLKPQQQKIIDALARAWEAIDASTILQLSKLYRENITSNQISSQLKQLEDNQLVETIQIGKRKKLYRIRERFFNIWYLMRNGRKHNREQVLWLIKFLETWCTVEELQEIALKQIESLGCGKYSEKGAYYKALALNNIYSIDDNTKEQLLKNTEDFLLKAEKHTWADSIHTLLKDIQENSWLQKAKKAFQEKKLTEAKEIILKAIDSNKKGAEYSMGTFYKEVLKDFDRAEEYLLKAIDKGEIEAIYYIANLYKQNLRNFDKAEEYYLKAIEKGYTGAFNNLANLYLNEKEDINKAEEYYLKAIEHGSTDAINNIANLYKVKKKDFDKAEVYYLKAIDLGNTKALNNLANLYRDIRKDFDKAEEYYLKAIEKGESKYALVNLANLYSEERKDFDKAEEYYLYAIEKGNRNAYNKLADFYRKVKKDFNKAEKYYLKGIEKGESKFSFYNLAELYLDVKKNINKAEEYFLKAIDADNVDAYNNLAILYERDKKDFDKAEQYYLKAIDKGSNNALNNLAILYAEIKKDNKKAEEYFLKAKVSQEFFIYNLFYFYWMNDNQIKALDFCVEVFQKQNYFEKAPEFVIKIILKLISERQYHFLLNEYKKENSLLLKYMQPFYYVIAWYLKEELPGEYEKAGSELKETVDEIIKTVEETRRKTNNNQK